MIDTKLGKFGIWSLFIVIILTFGLRLFYFGTFFLIKRVDPTIFCRHASDNMYADDIYFSAEAEETGILSDFNEKIDGFQEVVDSCIISSNNYELRLFLDEHIEEVLAVAKENNIYIDYLKNKGSSLECLSEYIHNMAKLDDNILQMAMYLSFVVICIVSLTKFKYRKGFYVASAIVYLIAMTSIFSDGLTDYIVSNIFAFVAKINKEIGIEGTGRRIAPISSLFKLYCPPPCLRITAICSRTRGVINKIFTYSGNTIVVSKRYLMR